MSRIIPTKIPSNKVKILELDKTVLVNGFINGFIESDHNKRFSTGVSTMPGYCVINGDEMYLSDNILDYVNIINRTVNRVNLSYENNHSTNYTTNYNIAYGISISTVSTISATNDQFKNELLESSEMLFYVNKLNEINEPNKTNKYNYLNEFREFILSSKILASVTIQPGAKHYLNLQEQLKVTIPEFFI